MHGPDGTHYPNWLTWQEITPPERIVLLHGDHPGDPNAFTSFITFEPVDGSTQLTMHTVFLTKELRDDAVERYGAIEGGRQTLGRLASTSPRPHTRTSRSPGPAVHSPVARRHHVTRPCPQLLRLPRRLRRRRGPTSGGTVRSRRAPPHGVGDPHPHLHRDGLPR
ncbi:SRPBCC domain-containing protein [Salana multivorans]